MGAAARADVPDIAAIVVPTEKNDEPNAAQRPLNSRRFSNCLFILHSRRRSTGPTDQATRERRFAARHAVVSGRQSAPQPRAGRGAGEACHGREMHSSAALTLAWVVSRADHIVPIPGTSHRTGSRKMPPYR